MKEQGLSSISIFLNIIFSFFGCPVQSVRDLSRVDCTYLQASTSSIKRLVVGIFQ